MCQTFAKEHRTLGLFSEEEGESIHKVVNEQCRQLVSVRNPAEKNLLLHTRLELSSSTSREALETKHRKCRKCGVFLRRGKCACVT